MARKKKKAPTPAKKKKKKKADPVAELLSDHPHLSRDQATEIHQSGLSVEEWEKKQEEAKEARRIAKQERMAKLLQTQHPRLTAEQALACVQQNMTPDEYFEQERNKQREARQRQRGGGRPGGGPRHGGKRHGGKGGPRRGGKPSAGAKQAARRKQIDSLLEQYPELTRAIAGQIVSGNLTYQQYLSSREKRLQKAQSHRTQEEIEEARQAREKRKQDLQERVANEAHLGATGDSYIKRLIEEEVHVEILRFHAPSFDGTIVEVEPFLLFLKTSTQPKLKLIKRYCTLFFKKEEQNLVYSQLRIAPLQFSLRQYPHREPSKRYKVPKKLMEAGAPLWTLLHNGLLLGGDIIWADRFQFLLRLPEGGEIFVFKHSVHFASDEEFTPEGGSHTLAEFFSNKPSLPKPHPEVLPPKEIEVPANFNDFPVKDDLYKKYLEAFEQDDFELKPVTVRREGDSYVLIDGYRRLTLAVEKGIDSLPIIVL